MIEFRCFRNDDPPRLADVWRSAELGPSAMQPMTSALLEAAVFSKPYFDREGLIVAVDGERTVGFAHAGFGPTADRRGIDPRIGTTLLVVVVPHAEHDAIGDGLLQRTESFLRSRGATTILGGGSSAMRSFYLGLYGGSDLPGILDSSPGMQSAFRRAGYGVAERIAVVRRRLSGFRPPVNRLQLAIRRNTVMRVIDEPGRRTWWEAATTTGIALRRYELRNQAEELLGAASFWDMQPLSSAWGVTAAGLMHVDIVGLRRRQGLAKYLVAEAMHDLADEGVSLVEAHVSDANTAAMKLFESLGFEAAEHGSIFRRDAG
ncbi:MAG: GNAT family N-acetyltransferase [Planctomycetia bacterium]